MLKLQGYDLKIYYRKGKHNEDADWLSRALQQPEPYSDVIYTKPYLHPSELSELPEESGIESVQGSSVMLELQEGYIPKTVFPIDPFLTPTCNYISGARRTWDASMFEQGQSEGPLQKYIQAPLELAKAQMEDEELKP